MHRPDDTAWKVVLCGDLKVGKSQLLNRVVHDAFEPRYESSTRVNVTFQRYSAVKLQLCDVAGFHPRAIMPAYFRGSHVIMIVYDVADPTSVEKISALYGEATITIPILPGGHLFVVVVGTKADLLPDGGASLMTDAALHQGALPAGAVADSTAAVQAADAFCEKEHLPHFIVSAKTGAGVEGMIREAVDASLRVRGYPSSAVKGGVRLPFK